MNGGSGRLVSRGMENWKGFGALDMLVLDWSSLKKLSAIDLDPAVETAFDAPGIATGSVNT